MTFSGRLLVAATCLLAAACGLIAGVTDVPIPLDGGEGDGSSPTDGTTRHGDGARDAAPPGLDASTEGGHVTTPDGGTDGGHDSGVDASSHDTGPKADASDAGPLPDGYIRCLSTTASCNAAGGQECCLVVAGQILADGSTFMFSSATCEDAGGPNCGSFASEGAAYQEYFPTTCATAADCPGGQVCCGEESPGSPPMIGGIACTAATECSAEGKIVCTQPTDCPAGSTCVVEPDPVLSHLWPRSCSP